MNQFQKGKKIAERTLLVSTLILFFLIAVVIESTAQSFSTTKSNSVECTDSQELIASKLPWDAIITAGCEDRKDTKSAHNTCDAVDIRIINEMFRSNGKVANKENLDLFNQWARDGLFQIFIDDYKVQEFYIEVPYNKGNRKGDKMRSNLKAALDVDYWPHIIYNPHATALHLHIGRWKPIEDKLVTMVVTENEAKEMKVKKNKEYEFENRAILSKDEFLPEIDPSRIDWDEGKILDNAETVTEDNKKVNWDKGTIVNIERKDTSFIAEFEDATAEVAIKWEPKNESLEKIDDRDVGLWTVLLKWRKDALIYEGITDPEMHKIARNELVRLFTLVYSKDRYHLPRHKVLSLCVLSTQMNNTDKFKALSDFFTYTGDDAMLRLFDENVKFRPGFLKQVYLDPTKINMSKIKAQLYSKLTYTK